MMSDDCNDSIDDEHDAAACDGGSRSEDADEEDTDLIMLVCSVIEDNRKQQLHVKRAYNTIRELGRDILGDEYDELRRDLECIERLRIQLNQNFNDHFSSQLGESKMDEMLDFVEGRVERYLSSSLNDEESNSRLSLGSRSSSTRGGGDDESFQSTGVSTSHHYNDNEEREMELAIETKRLEKEKRLVSAKEAELAEREQALAKKEKAAKEDLRKKTEKAKTRMEAEYRKKMEEVKRLEAEAKKRISQLETNAKAEEADRLRIEHERRLTLERTKTPDTQSNNDADDASKNGDDTSSYQRETGARHRSSSRNQSNGGHVPFSGSTTEESNALGETHEQAKLLADEEAQAKLAAEQRLEKEILDRERQRWESDMKQCNDMQQSLALAMSDESTTQPLLAVKTNFLDTLSDILDVISNPQHPEHLDSLLSVATDAICIIGPLINASNVVACQKKGEASKMASVFGKRNATLASLADCCDTTKKDPSETEDPMVAAELERVQKAICLYNKDDINDITEAKLSKKVEKFVLVGHPTRNMLTHIFHLVIGHLVISELTLADSVAHLPEDVAEKLINDAAELARLVNPKQSATFSSSMTILSYLNTFAFRGLENDAWEQLASQVVLRIFDSLTNVGSSSTAVETHDRLVKPHFKRSQHYTVSGGINNESGGIDYCSGNTRLHRDRRRRITRLCALWILKRSITRRFPNGLFDECGGYTRCLLRLSPCNIITQFTFVREKLFENDCGIDSKQVEKLKTTVLKKQKQNVGERTLLIENDEQITSLKRLLKCLLDGVPRLMEEN